MKYEMVTFAEGNLRWTWSAKRLLREASLSQYFSSVRQIRLEDLMMFEQITEMVSSRFISEKSKGFGFWAWKPFAIKKALIELKEHDCGVVYVDAGCSINYGNESANARIHEYFRLAEEEPLFFEIPGHPEKYWSKRAAIDACRDLPPDSLDKNQLVGGISFWPNNQRSFEILDAWIDLITQENHRLLLDVIDTSIEIKGFSAHRNDQSLMSLAAKQHGAQVLKDETWFKEGWSGRAVSFPIWATRLKSGISVFKMGPFWDILRKIEDLIFRSIDLACRRLG